MDFLSPWYLLGAAAIIAPILLHLRRRPPKDFVPFSTLMFLDKTPERLTRRSKLERLWLLLLRCAVMILLALLFARPFFNSDKAGLGGGEGRRVVVLLDRSGSMQRDGMWKKALAKADEILEEASSSDEIAFATFDDELNLLSGFDASREASTGAQIKALRAQLKELEVGWGGSELGNALIASADLIEAASAESGERQAKEIIVISDFQEGAERDSLNRFAWPESIRVRCVPVEPEQAANLTINLVATLREGEDEADEADIDDETRASGAQQRVRIRNARAGGREATFALRWEGEDSDSTTEKEDGVEAVVVRGQIPPGGSRVVSAPPRADESADGVLVLEADGDDHDFDNHAYVARIQPRPVRVLYVSQKPEPENPATPLFYLLRAMQPTSVLTPQVESVALADLAAEDVESADLVVVAATPSKEVAGQLGKALNSGTAIFWICREAGQEEAGEDSASAASTALDAVTGLDGWSISEAPRRGVGKDEYAMLSNLDFESPVLAAFARAKVRDFTGIHIWKHRLVELPKTTGDDDEANRPRVLASYDGGAPAWLEVRRGAGRLYVFTAGWEPAESQLALSSKFVPLLYAMLGEAGFSALVPEPLVVGEPLPVPLGVTATTVKLPDGSSVESGVNEGVFLRTENPGLYSVSDGASERVYAVNLAPDESRVDSFDPLLLADFSLPVLVDAAELATDVASGRRAAEAREEAEVEQRRLEQSEKEKRQKLWKWLVLAVLGVLLLESWVAGRVPGTDESGSEPTGQPV